MDRRLTSMLLAFALLWHALAVLAHGWMPAVRDEHGRDFASYFYAVEVARQGGDPYDKRALGDVAQDDGTRATVNPYFYPPPFLLLMAWVQPFTLLQAYRLWFWLDEACLWGVVLVLARWWRALGSSVPAVLAVTVALLTAIYDNHAMGQANLPVLLLAVAGLWQEDEGRPWLGGALVGAACMMKMSPALFVLWWLLHRRWSPAAAACVTGAALSVLALAFVPLHTQIHFYRDVLPGFGSGIYNGLSVPITMFGNHSIPNLWAQLFPNRAQGLSTAAHGLSNLSALVLVGALGWTFRQPPADAFARAGQAAAVAVAMLLVPVYTYEHHVVWAIPAVAVSIVGLVEGRLDRRFAIPLGLALAAWAYDLGDMKAMAAAFPLASWGFQEAKSFALMALLATSAVVGVSRTKASA